MQISLGILFSQPQFSEQSFYVNLQLKEENLHCLCNKDKNFSQNQQNSGQCSVKSLDKKIAISSRIIEKIYPSVTELRRILRKGSRNCGVKQNIGRKIQTVSKSVDSEANKIQVTYK